MDEDGDVLRGGSFGTSFDDVVESQATSERNELVHKAWQRLSCKTPVPLLSYGTIALD